MKYSYQIICQDLLKDSPERVKNIIERRFGLTKQNSKQETLESIGQTYGLTRERVRQIQDVALVRIREKAELKYSDVFNYFIDYIKKQGGFRREDLLFNELGKNYENNIFFLMILGEPFERLRENKDFYSFWTINKNSSDYAKKTINSFVSYLKKEEKPEPIKNFQLPSSILIKVRKSGWNKEWIKSSLEISKYILKGVDNLYGLGDWIETNPKTVRDKVYLVFKKQNKPLHFSQIPGIIEELKTSISEEPVLERNWIKPIHPQTVHNELIKDPRFVLIGRGLYVLKDWGYSPGMVKDVILKILKENKKALTKEEIVNKVLSQRQVKENTILLNLQDKNYFLKDPKGRYIIRSG